MAEELEAGAVQHVAAGFGRQVDDAAVEAAEFRRRAVALDLEFLNRVDDREERHLPGSGCSTEMPSNRYSLVRGRPPLMRGNCEFGGSATPGASGASVMKLRPLSGSCDDLLVLDDLAEAARSRRAAAVRQP